MFNNHVVQYYIHLFFQREKECASKSEPYQCDSEWRRLVNLATGKNMVIKLTQTELMEIK